MMNCLGLGRKNRCAHRMPSERACPQAYHYMEDQSQTCCPAREEEPTTLALAALMAAAVPCIGCKAGGCFANHSECLATRYRCPIQKRSCDNEHETPLLAPHTRLQNPPPAPKGKSLKISHSSHFCGATQSIYLVAMNFFTKNQKKYLPATPCWRKHIFAPKWWNW